MNLRDVPWGLVLSLGIVALLGCTSQISTSNPAIQSADPADPADPADLAAPPVADDRRADGLFAYTDPGRLPQLYVSGEDEVALPLEHTAVDARVRGHVAEVRVRQRFSNDRAKAIEVTYVFPLPENAAVDDMRMVIGERVIESEIQTRARARGTYESARAAGHTAALLEQERPNVFTQSVANIAPGETIEVEIRYLQTLSQDGGVQEFVFPMVVGPRYVNDRVPDAARITPPILGEGERTGHDVSLELEVDAGHSIDRWTAPTHTVVGAATTQGFSLRLADAQTIPNRDFVLRWQVGAAQAQASLFMGPSDGKRPGHFALLIQPPQLDLDELVGRREMIFVIDRSGSMYGVPLALAKQTLREALPRMRPVDRFDIVSFESGTERLFGDSRPANQENLVLAERFIDGLEAGGWTEMASAVDAALRPPLYAGERRYVFFLTDGYIGDEQQIFSAAAELVARAEDAGGRARVFGVGIGSAPNRELIAGLSRAGVGAPLYVRNREHPRAVVDDYQHWIDHAVLEDLRVDWGGLAVDSVYPSAPPDLFASHVVVLHGRYAGQVTSDIKIYARVPGQPDEIELAVRVSPSPVDDRILSTLWARQKIDDLISSSWNGHMDQTALERAITDVGLEYHLVTAHTSLVAVDRSRVVGDGDPLALIQAVEVPEDVDPQMAGSRSSYKVMPQLEKKAKEIAELERKQEAERRKQLLALEKQALEAGARTGELRVSATDHQAAIEKAVTSTSSLIHCFAGDRVERLRYRLEFDADGSLRALTRLAADSDHTELHACVERSLRQIGWSDRFDTAGVTIEFELIFDPPRPQ